MTTTITIDKAGRLVIPVDVRERYRLSAGSELILSEESGRVVLTPTNGLPELIEHRGLLLLRLPEGSAIPADHLALRRERLDELVAYALKK
jgi:AbrB family looped-hinge helix DNA binding protein